MNKIGWVENKRYWKPSSRDMKIARQRVAGRKEAFAETLARVVFDDIARGLEGGSYYMDGRDVNVSDFDLFSVGGAHDGIILTTEEIKSEGDVQAAVELLREAIAELQATSDDDICFGFWVDNGLCYFDVSNVVRGCDEALGLAQRRGELAIYQFATGEEIDVVRNANRAWSSKVRADRAKSYAVYRRQRANRQKYITLGEAKRSKAYRKYKSPYRKKAAEKPVYRLDVAIEFELFVDNARAAMNNPDDITIQERSGIEIPYSMHDISQYKILIGLVRAVIVEEGFYIEEEYQSSQSYSYYIEFETKDAVVQVQFRISDHIRSGKEEFYGNGNRRFKDFLLGPNEYDDQIAVQRAARAACKAALICDWSLFNRIA